MKKFISMVMAAAMVVTMVPATAFAADDATFKVVGAEEYTVEDAEFMLADVIENEDGTETEKDLTPIAGPEVQIKIVDVDQKKTVDGEEVGTWEVTLDFEGAEFDNGARTGDVCFSEGQNVTSIVEKNGRNWAADAVFVKVVDDVENEDSSITLEISKEVKLVEDDVLSIDLSDLGLVLTSDNAGHEATVAVSGDFGDSDAMVFASVLKEGIKVTLKKVAEVAVEDETTLKKDLTIEANVDEFAEDQIFELVLSKGFEFSYLIGQNNKDSEDNTRYAYNVRDVDGNEAVIQLNGATAEFDIPAAAMEIEAVDAEAGDVCAITVKAKTSFKTFKSEDGIKATAEAVDAVKVVSDSVILSVDEDEDVPVMYSGVNLDEIGLTSEEDHTSLEITIKESVAEAWDLKKAFTLSLPDGVYVVNSGDEVEAVAEGDDEIANDGVDVITNEDDNLLAVKGGTGAEEDAIVGAFAKAYNEGDYKMFDFSRKAFDRDDKETVIELTFTLELVADAGFVGPVVLTMDYEGETQEVTIAEFVTPMVVEAASNDVIIDYRNTEVPTDIVVKETEAGLWNDGLKVGFYVDEPAMYNDGIVFEDTFEVTVDEASEMEIEDEGIGFAVTEKSDEEAAVVTVSDIELYMNRSVPAGAYDLGMSYAVEYTENRDGEPINEYLASPLFGAEAGKYEIVDDVTDMDGIVKEGWINVITAGRDQDDASFTKKVVVTIGADTIVAGEEAVALDVPAYINAAGYTMLPVRAVAVALGINTNNVLWDQATKTVTILYGQRIITMQAGSKVVNVNGSAIPASAAVEIVNGRTFLGLRDLATALGVVDITWDGATQTATLNGNK